MRLKWKKTDWKGHRCKDRLLKNKTVLLLLAAVLFGVILGIRACAGSAGASERLQESVNAFLARRAGQPFWQGFGDALRSVLVFAGSLTVCGMSLGGTVLLPAVMLFRGIGLGAVGGALCKAYGVRGALYGGLVLLPGALCSTAVLLLMAQAGMHFSELLFAYLKEERSASLQKPFLRYIAQIGIGWLLFCPMALLESGWNLLLRGVFHLG